MGLNNSLRWSLLWICLLAGCISVLGQGGNVRRVYRRNGNYGRRIIPQVSSVLQTPSRHSRAHEPLLEAETRRVGKAIHRPSNRLVLPTIDRQDQDAEETESAGYSYTAPESTTANTGYAYQRPSPIAEHNPETEDEAELVDESPAHVTPEREAEFPQQDEAAFGLISEQDVAAEELQPEEAPPNPVVDSPIAQLSDSDTQCNENDHDCWPHGYKGVIRGEAGTDYPILTEIIPTAFDCDNVQYSGYYADTDEQARCQIFHICLKRNKYRSTQKWSFLCPNGTVFDQGNFVCVWWDMAPDCNPQTVESMYSLNEALGWDNITETEFDVNSVMSAMGDSQKSRHFQDSGLSLHQSSTRLKNTIVELPTTRPPPATTYRPRTRTTPQQQLQTSSRNSAYRIPIRVSDGARDRTALKSVTNNIGDYSDAEHETDESSKYETSLRTEHQTEARYKTKSGSTLLQSQSEAYEEKSNPQSIRPFIVNNRKPYVDRDETTTISARDNKVPTVVMMQAQHRYPDGSEGVVNVPVIIMHPKNHQQVETDYSLQQDEAASSNVETPQSRYLPPSKTTEEYDPVEQPAHSTQPSRYLPPATEVIPPTTEDTQYQQELDQQAQGVVTEDSVPVDEVDTTTDIDEGYRYPKPIRMAVNTPFFESLRTTTRDASGYRYPKPTTTIQPEYVPQEESTTEAEGYRYPKPTSREPEYNQHQQQEISTHENLVGTTLEEFSTASPTEAQTQSNVYLPPKEEQTERPQSNVYLPPKGEQTERPQSNTHLPPKGDQTESPQSNTYLPPKGDQTERPQSNTYLPPKEEQTDRPQSNTYLPPKDEQTTVLPQSSTYVSQVEETTQNPQPGTYLPPKSERTTVKPQPTAYLPPKTEQTTAKSQPGAYLPPKVEQTTTQHSTEQTTEQSVETLATELSSSTTTQQEAATDSPNAYLPPKNTEGYSNTNSNNGEIKTKPATGRAITKVIASVAPIENNPTEILLPGVDSKDETETEEEQSSEESNEVVTDSPQDEEEKFHFPTPATPVVTPDSEDLGTPSQLYNANVRQQLYAKNKSKPQSYEENPESQEKINEIIRQLQAGIAEAEDSNGQKIDFSQFAKLNKQIALVVPQPGGNGTEQTSQTLIFDTSTESITEALKNAIPSSAPSPSEIPLSIPSAETLPIVEDYVQNPFTSSFSSINTPQYEINLPTKEFESHSIQNTIDHDQNLNSRQFSALFNNVNNNIPQRSQPQISNFIQPQVSVQTQTIQNLPVLYNQPQPTQNYILPIASPTPQQFKPQQLFFQPQPHQQEPLYSPPPLPVQNQQNFNQPQQQNFVQSQPPQQNFIQSQPQQQNFIQSQPQQQNFVQSQPQQQNFVQSQPQQQQNFVPSPAQEQHNFLPSQPPQQPNFVYSQPPQQNIIQDQPRQQNYIAEQPRQQNFIESQQKQNFIQEQQPQQNFIQQQPQRQNYRTATPQQADILRIPEQQNFAQSQPQQANLNNQRQPQQSQSDNRYLPPGRRNYSRQFQFNNQQQQQSFQQPQQAQATFNQPQIVDFSPAKTPSLESLTTKKTKLINPADIKIVPAIFVHHHTSVENPDGSPVRDEKSSQQPPQQTRQQQSFQNSGFYEPPPTQRRNLNNQFRNNNNFLPLSAQQTENVAVTVKPPAKSGRSQSHTSSSPPPSPSNVFTPQISVPAPQIEKFTLDDARTVDQLQIYHKQNLRTFRPLQPTNPSVESSTVYTGAGSGRLDMSPEQSSIADTSRFYPGRDNSLGVKLTYN